MQIPDIFFKDYQPPLWLMKKEAGFWVLAAFGVLAAWGALK